MPNPSLSSGSSSTAGATLSAPNPSPRRGDIYWVNVPQKHTVGSEQYKRRPWLIISNNAIGYLRVVIGVPLSFKIQKKNRQFRITILAADIILDPGSTMTAGERVALTEQVRALSVERLEPTRQARITDTALFAVEAGIAFVLDLQ
jgi:mRNA-degrading endonuclease toxin of MazEF toxin-antitoxin module